MKNTLILMLLCPMALFGQKFENRISEDNDMFSDFIKLTSQQLYDTADYYHKKKSCDTALICYSLIIKTIPKSAEIEQQKKLSRIYNRMANLHMLMSDYRAAYSIFIDELLICEKYNIIENKSLVYLNLGIIYNNLKHYEMSNQYYLKSLDISFDSAKTVLILNSLGDNQIKRGNLDSAYYYIDKSMKLSKQHNDVYLSLIFNTLGSYYKEVKLYDSAYYYFKLSLEQTSANKIIEGEATNLSDLGKLFFEINKLDSALYYTGLSNKIASEYKFLKILSDNYLTLSEIDKSKGNFKSALNHYTTYNNLKDSIYNAEVYASVNLYQRQYEVSKTNKQIEEFIIDRQLKEHTIHYQKVIQLIIICVLAILIGILYILLDQNGKLKKSHKALFDKNIEIVKLLEKSTEKTKTKNKRSKTIIETHKGLIDKIISIMENMTIVCNSDFSINVLAGMIKLNHKYISEVVNDTFNKNFRSLLNSYRIREAQRLFSEPATSIYTIESVAHQVGFNSRSAFREAFKEVTGVSPSYYIKSLYEQKDDIPPDDEVKN